MTALYFLLGGLVAWGIVYGFLYSPKAQIERLWKEVFSLAFRIKEQKKISGDIHDSLAREWQKRSERKKKMINTLIEYYFDPEEDEDYIRENKA